MIKDKGKYLINKVMIACMIMVSMIIFMPIGIYAEAMTVNYAGKTYDYNKKPVTITYNGSVIKTTMPGLILNNTAMLPANKVFSGHYMDSNYEYLSKKKIIIIQKDDIEITYVLNRTYAYINGVKRKLDEPARVIKNLETGKSYVMVPGRFTVQALGYSYHWDNDTATSEIAENETNEGNNLDEDTVDEDHSGEDTTEDNSTDAAHSLTIMKSIGCDLKMIGQEDDYRNKQYRVSFEGDVGDAISNNLKIDLSACSVRTQLNEDDNTDLFLQTKQIQAFIVKDEEDILTIDVKNPTEVYDRIVVIDTGHGGKDPGANSKGYQVKESDLALQLTMCAKKYLDEGSSIKVYYTRLSEDQNGITIGSGVANKNQSLVQRVAFANGIGADLFISIHVNSFGSEATGTEILYSHYNNQKYSSGLNSYKLADIAFPKILDALKLKKRSILDDENIAVVKNTKMPAILIEPGFISTDRDLKVMTDPEVQDRFGEAVYETIKEAMELYPPVRSY